jgi:enoyl-CoA hydratase/carnithine racemase
VTSQREHRATVEPRVAGVRASAIEVEVRDRIAVVTFNRPERRNAFTLEMWRDVPRICAALDADAGVRGIVFTGAAGNFSAGADILEFEVVRKTTADAHVYEEAVDACCDAIAVISKPTIAAIGGFCMGGGCHVAVSCDFRFAGPEAAFGIPAAKLSIVYGIRATQKLLALVGMANAKRILYAGDRIAAAEAQSLGLVDRIVSTPLAAATEFARALAENAPLSIAGSKTLINGLAMGLGSLDPAEARRVMDRAAASDDYAEGRRAFAEKRRPNFKGR